jgi:hypothetical protein
MSAILTIYPAETQHPHGADPGGRMPAPPIRGRAPAFCPVHTALVISASEPSSPTRKTESHMAAMPRIAHEQLQVHQSNWAPAACRRPDCRRHPRTVEPANWLQYGPWSETRTEAHGNRYGALIAASGWAVLGAPECSSCAGLSDAGRRLGSGQSAAPGEPVRGRKPRWDAAIMWVSRWPVVWADTPASRRRRACRVRRAPGPGRSSGRATDRRV